MPRKKTTVAQLIKALEKCEPSAEVVVHPPGIDDGVPIVDVDTTSDYAGLYMGKVKSDTGRSSALALLGDIELMAQKAAGYLEGD
jgi:hypothetical protein